MQVKFTTKKSLFINNQMILKKSNLSLRKSANISAALQGILNPEIAIRAPITPANTTDPHNKRTCFFPILSCFDFTVSHIKGIKIRQAQTIKNMTQKATHTGVNTANFPGSPNDDKVLSNK